MTYLGNPKADPDDCQIDWPVPLRNPQMEQRERVAIRTNSRQV